MSHSLNDTVDLISLDTQGLGVPARSLAAAKGIRQEVFRRLIDSFPSVEPSALISTCNQYPLASWWLTQNVQGALHAFGVEDTHETWRTL